jgi:hypothetical protein
MVCNKVVCEVFPISQIMPSIPLKIVALNSDVDLWCDNGDRNGEVIIWPWHANCLLSLGRLEAVIKRGHIRLQFFM